MQKIFLTAIILFGLMNFSSAQITAKVDSTSPVMSGKKANTAQENVVFARVEKEASFPGGLAGWRDFLMKNLDAYVPIANKAPNGTYTVIIRFIVSKDGSISDVEAETNKGYGMEAEAIRVIKMGPKWIAARQNGRVVNAYRRQPITFVVQ
ncbi:energy transducer TonB [Ferruginibacter albus]|uniref:energy transducer TonB n=1 Tax=Ferruginibacter albus TaxID=2875540 RepID=UPI001CC61420|nr:energy transducer TonB [Ferruginibacter albus]UAY51122.1 energy transducer TonB [Ferruginibacter albus]